MKRRLLGIASCGAAAACVAWSLAACGGDDPAASTGQVDAAPEASGQPEAAADSGGPDADRNTAGQCGAALFAKRWGGSLPDGLTSPGESAAGLATDAQDNLYVTGWFRGDADFGTGVPDAGGSNASLFLLKLDAKRAPVWSRAFGDPRASLITVPFARGLALAAHPAGGVVVGGNFAGTLPLGGAPLASAGGACATGAGDCVADAFVARFDDAGNQVFGVRFGSPGADAARALVVDAAGNSIVAGTFEGTVDFGGGALTSAGKSDVFVVTLDAKGAHAGSFRLGGVEDEALGGIAVLASGDLVVGGSFAGSLALGTTTITAKGTRDGFVARLSPAGEVRWVHALGASKKGAVRGVAVDAQGNAYLAGSVDGTMELGAKQGVRLDDAFATKLDASGNVIWAKVWGGDSNDLAGPITVDPNGAVIVAGQTDSIGGVDFGGGVIGGGATGGPFVVDLAADGTHRCSRSFPARSLPGPKDGSVEYVLGTAGAAIAVGTKSIVLGGQLGGVIDFGKGDLTSAGGLDIYAAELAR